MKMIDSYASSGDKRVNEDKPKKYIIEDVEVDTNCNGINLENRKIAELPQKLFSLHQLKRITLSKNKIKTLPDQFFDSFPQLTWLDLRYNKLEFLSRKVANLKKLNYLLLGNNRIKRLCIEIGGIPNLNGLNIEGNPLEFPAERILSKGFKDIIQYLQECYNERVELESNPLINVFDSKVAW